MAMAAGVALFAPARERISVCSDWSRSSSGVSALVASCCREIARPGVNALLVLADDAPALADAIGTLERVATRSWL